MTFDLHIKNFNLGHNFWTIRGRALIFHMCIPCDKTFPLMPTFLNLWPRPWPLTTVAKNLNLDHYFGTITDRVFIFHMCIPCDKTFPLVPKFVTVTFDLPTLMLPSGGCSSCFLLIWRRVPLILVHTIFKAMCSGINDVCDSSSLKQLFG